MTILHFPSERQQLERRVRELGGMVIWADATPDDTALTPRESDVLATLGWKLERSPTSIAADIDLSVGRVRNMLTSLRRKGYAARCGHYHDGGWIKVKDIEQELERAA
jgi:DNA-binding MarR family transcriptional regulator